MGEFVTGYAVKDFDLKTKMMIKFKGIDENQNGYIEEGNELSNLLSATGNSSIYDFEDWEFPHIKEGFYAGALSVGCAALAGVGAAMIPKPGSKKTIGNITRNIAGRILASPVTGFGTIFFAIGAAALLGIGCITPEKRRIGHKIFETESKQPQVQPQPQPVVQPTEQEEIKAKFEEGFKELGISEDTELKEYTPQKGEYWISILKAKYGVDDVTAQKMANKIKEMIYDDPKASKQTPIMYLPQTWTFEGQTYQYNDSSTVVTADNYSNDVKTEMGKMSKDLKYD